MSEHLCVSLLCWTGMLDSCARGIWRRPSTSHISFVGFVSLCCLRWKLCGGFDRVVSRDVSPWWGLLSVPAGTTADEQRSREVRQEVGLASMSAHRRIAGELRLG